jgi:adenylyltransferase/sulfurtransferase
MLLGFEISAEQLKARLDAGEELLVLDVRDLSEYSIANIRGAKLTPLVSLPTRLDALAEWRHKPVVIYCHKGEDSMRAMELLKDGGFTDLKILEGGIDAWCERIEPHQARYGQSEGEGGCG